MTRASRSDGAPITPMTLGNMRALGVRRVEAICENLLCRHAGVVEVDALPGEIPVPDLSAALFPVRRRDRQHAPALAGVSGERRRAAVRPPVWSGRY